MFNQGQWGRIQSNLYLLFKNKPGKILIARRVNLFRDSLPFLRGHLFGNGDDTDTAEVETVGIETGIDGGIACAVGASVKTDGFLEHFELLV